jgi:hypothetical protein
MLEYEYVVVQRLWDMILRSGITYGELAKKLSVPAKTMKMILRGCNHHGDAFCAGYGLHEELATDRVRDRFAIGMSLRSWAYVTALRIDGKIIGLLDPQTYFDHAENSVNLRINAKPMMSDMGIPASMMRLGSPNGMSAEECRRVKPASYANKIRQLYGLKNPARQAFTLPVMLTAEGKFQIVTQSVDNNGYLGMAITSYPNKIILAINTHPRVTPQTRLYTLCFLLSAVTRQGRGLHMFNDHNTENDEDYKYLAAVAAHMMAPVAGMDDLANEHTNLGPRLGEDFIRFMSAYYGSSWRTTSFSLLNTLDRSVDRERAEVSSNNSVYAARPHFKYDMSAEEMAYERAPFHGLHVERDASKDYRILF